MAQQHPRVRVLKNVVGDEFTVSYGGPDDTVTYKPDNGVVAVRPEHLERFLGAVEGSTVVGDTASGTSKE